MTGDLNELMRETKRRRVNHKDVFWLRSHLMECPELTDADIERLREYKPKRNQLHMRVVIALHG
ncbi:MAG: hypothetical protein HC794_08785 [Nitrospiraceae bacterium]|nr:hypothetical protein [Nitrospiraceae bacterium]